MADPAEGANGVAGAACRPRGGRRGSLSNQRRGSVVAGEEGPGRAVGSVGRARLLAVSTEPHRPDTSAAECLPRGCWLDAAMAVGEQAQRTGEDGARRARRWLEATTRVGQSWTNEDAVVAGRLSFDWPHGGQPFSFDIGGVLKGEPYQHHLFVAGVKKYKEASDQGTHYNDWVAKCYVVRKVNPAIAEHFMWITWTPFRITEWQNLMTAETVVKGLLTEKNRKRVFDTDDVDEARKLIDLGLAAEIAQRLWLIVLSEKQEKLVITNEHRSWIVAREIQEAN